MTFGGMGKCAFGPGIKAGGPNYVAQLMHFNGSDDPTHVEIHNEALAHLVDDPRPRRRRVSIVFPEGWPVSIRFMPAE